MATNNSSNQNNIGIQCLDSSGVIQGRALTGTTNQISVTNGDGTAGNPTYTFTDPLIPPGIYGAASGSTGSIANNGTFTIISSIAPTTVVMYLVGCYATGTASSVRAFAFAGRNATGSPAATCDSITNTGCTLTISSNNLILTNTSGGPLSFNYGYITFDK